MHIALYFLTRGSVPFMTQLLGSYKIKTIVEKIQARYINRAVGTENITNSLF